MSVRFSIITVVLNPSTEDLHNTVISVLEQKEQDWELIIKDGGSDTQCLASIPSDPRIRLITRADSGIFDAMNQAIDLAGGRLICFLNAGDSFYDSWALSHVAEGIDSSPQADFIYGDVAKPSSRSGFERYSNRLTKSYLFGHMICHQAWFVSKRYYDRPERYETDLPTGGDGRFLLRMVLQRKVAYRHIGRVIVSYKGGGVSQRPANIRAAVTWRDELVRSIFTATEYRFFSVRKRLVKSVKSLVYDRGLWRLRRIWARRQANRQLPASVVGIPPLSGPPITKSASLGSPLPVHVTGSGSVGSSLKPEPIGGSGLADAARETGVTRQSDSAWEVKAKAGRLAIVQVLLAVYRKSLFIEIARGVGSLALISDRESSSSVRKVRFDDSGNKESGIEEFHVASIWRGPLLFQKGLLGVLKRGNFDAVVLPGTVQFMTVWLALLLCRWRRVPVYLWTHGALGHEGRAKMILRRLMMRWSDGVLLYGNRAREILAASGVPQRKLHVIHNSIFHPPCFEELMKLRSGDARTLKQQLFPDTAALPVVVFIGRVLANKGIRMILSCVERAIRDGAPFNFLCVGGGPELTNLSAEVTTQGIAGYVTFTDECYDEAEVQKLLAVSDVCVYPGSVGLAAIHAMGCGVPVISHDDLRTQKPEFEVILPGITGDMYEFESLESLEVTIRKWLRYAELDREGVARRCWERVMEAYTPDTQARRFLEAVFGGPDR
jgi:glycosyltransferase involved in cell wall biosynthesis